MALATAAPLPFRLQLLCTVDGVQVYDNAVSTQLASTEQALRALRSRGRRVHWVGGGKSKDGDYASVARGIAELAASAHCFGAAAAPFHEAAEKAIPTTRHERMPDALGAALERAQPGEAVLFSPAFASFDQYPNFRARALEFHAALRERRASGGSPG